MTDDKKKVYVTHGGAGEATGILAAVLLIGIGLLVVAATLRDNKSMDVNVDLSKVGALNPGK